MYDRAFILWWLVSIRAIGCGKKLTVGNHLNTLMASLGFCGFRAATSHVHTFHDDERLFINSGMSTISFRIGSTPRFPERVPVHAQTDRSPANTNKEG
jgi:hypothetical protein